jgi:hypothetical protein
MSMPTRQAAARYPRFLAAQRRAQSAIRDPQPATRNPQSSMPGAEAAALRPRRLRDEVELDARENGNPGAPATASEPAKDIDNYECNVEIASTEEDVYVDLDPSKGPDRACEPGATLEPDPVTEAIAVATIADRRAEMRRQVAMTVALVPFAFAAAPFTHGWVGWVVFANGVLTHGSHAFLGEEVRPLVYWDVAWNVALSVYINVATAWQPGTATVTLTALIIWMANGGPRRVTSAALHIIGVQWTLCAMLWVYEYQRLCCA